MAVQVEIRRNEAAARLEAKLRIDTPEVFQPLLKSARFKGLHGGRGSGKSHFFGEDLVLECLKEPTRGVCIREVQHTLKESSKRLVEDKIRALGVADAFRVLDDRIEAPNDGNIIFQGMQNHTAESIKSLEGYRIAWVDEAHRLSSTSLGLLRPTIRAPGSQLWFSWNPKSAKDPVDAFLRGEVPPPRSVVVEVNYDDNPWFPEDLREEMEYDRRRDMERYRHVWLGQYQTRSEAIVFRNWRVENFHTPANLDEWTELGLKPRFYFGADWGFATDPTVLVRCWISGRTLYVDQEVWQIGCELDHTPALFRRVPESDKWAIVGDSSNPQAISYMRRHGFPRMQAAVKGPGSVEEGVEFLKSYDVVVHPRCPHVIDELSTFSFETDTLTEEVLPVLADRKNHTIDSLRYAVEGVRRAAVPAGFGRY